MSGNNTSWPGVTAIDDFDATMISVLLLEINMTRRNNHAGNRVDTRICGDFDYYSWRAARYQVRSITRKAGAHH